MKNITEKIKSYFGNFLKDDTSYERGGINPERDWNIMLVFVFAVLIVFSIIAFYFYIRINNGNLFSVPESANSVSATINQDLMNKTIQKIEANKSAFDFVQQNKASTTDPSI